MPDDPEDVVLPPRVADLLARPGTWEAPPALSAAALIAQASAPTLSPVTAAPPNSGASVAPPDSGASVAPPGSGASAASSGSGASVAPPDSGISAASSGSGISVVPPVSGASAASSGSGSSVARPDSGPSVASASPGDSPESAETSAGVVIPLRRRRWVRPVLAAAAALVLVAAVATGVLATRERPTATIELAGGVGDPAAHGRLRVIERDAGWRLVLDVQGLAPAPPGTYYQGWAIKGGEYVPLGTFHMHKSGQVEMWSGVPMKQFRRIEVTSQRVGAGQNPGTVVLAGGM
jgi:hypothetical protein